MTNGARAAFLDRDGDINRPVLGDEHRKTLRRHPDDTVSDMRKGAAIILRNRVIA